MQGLGHGDAQQVVEEAGDGAPGRVRVAAQAVQEHVPARMFRCTSLTTPKNERAYGKLLFAPKQSLVTCFRQSVRLSLRHLSSAAAGKSQPNKLKCLSRES